MKVRLKDPSGMFHDPQTGFTLIANEVKPLPQTMGELTRRWLNAGGLVKVSEPKVIVEEEVKEVTPQVQTPKDGTQEYLANFDRPEMMRLAKERGLKVGRSDKAVDLAKRLAQADLER